MLLYEDAIPSDGLVLTVGNNSTVNTNKTFSVVSLINALKIDAINQSKGLFILNNSAIKSALQGNNVDGSSSEFNNKGILPKSEKTDYKTYYIAGGVGLLALIFIIIISR